MNNALRGGNGGPRQVAALFLGSWRRSRPPDRTSAADCHGNPARSDITQPGWRSPRTPPHRHHAIRRKTMPPAGPRGGADLRRRSDAGAQHPRCSTFSPHNAGRHLLQSSPHGAGFSEGVRRGRDAGTDIGQPHPKYPPRGESWTRRTPRATLDHGLLVVAGRRWPMPG